MIEDLGDLQNEVQIQLQEKVDERNNIDLRVYVAPSIIIRLHIIFQIEINGVVGSSK